MALAIDVRDEAVESYADIVTELQELNSKGVPLNAVDRILVTEIQRDNLISDTDFIQTSERDTESDDGITVNGYDVLVA